MQTKCDAKSWAFDLRFQGQRIRKKDIEQLQGDMDLVASQMKDAMMEQHQMARNFSRLAYAVMDTVKYLKDGNAQEAMRACLEALGDVTATGYGNDEDTDEWVNNWLEDTDE